MQDCIFCKIVRKELPSYLIFEDENFIAFLDIRPLNPGHTLVSPKKHHRWVWDVPEAGRYFETVRIIAKTLQKTINTEWVVADIGGMGVPHAHVHVIPRFPGDEIVRASCRERAEIAGGGGVRGGGRRCV